MHSTLRVLLVGDVVGQAGLRALYAGLPKLVDEYRADAVVVNGENASDGFGLTPEIVGTLAEHGVDVITTGNHIWQKREILHELDTYSNVLRPANYPGNPPGSGSCVIEKGGIAIGVINLQGRVRLSTIDCPFRAAERLVQSLSGTTSVILVDFHAEDTEEKEAMGMHLDGSVSAVFGTHTHVQTDDDRLLEGGTAYITDLGMTGPIDAVIGFDTGTAIDRMISQMPLKMVVAETAASIHGACVEVDADSGKALSIERIDYTPAR